VTAAVLNVPHSAILRGSLALALQDEGRVFQASPKNLTLRYPAKPGLEGWTSVVRDGGG
jgi:hypothetical protein